MTIIILIIFSLLLAFASGAPQVLSEIDTYDDLLAIESQFIENEIEPSVQKILPPPTGFNGERSQHLHSSSRRDSLSPHLDSSQAQ
ncbi:Cuticle protein CP146, partial [Caligus rogercresseyi]